MTAYGRVVSGVLGGVKGPWNYAGPLLVRRSHSVEQQEKTMEEVFC